jgi:germacradienol/geosmin synthase
MISPLLEQVQKHTHQWVQDFYVFQDGNTLQRYCAMGIPELICRCQPKADLVALCISSDWTSWYISCDDAFELSDSHTRREDMRSVHESLLAVFHGSSPPSPQGPAAALADILQRTRSRGSSTWQEHFAQHHREYFAGTSWEAENHVDRRIPDVSTYREKRRDTVVASSYFDLIELAESFEIPVEIYESQPFQAILHTASQIIGWTNDLYSLEPDLARGEIHNLVVVVQHAEGCSLQQAIDLVSSMIKSETQHFQKLVQHFSVSSTEADKDIRPYLEDLGICLRGNLDWGTQSLRYQC